MEVFRISAEKYATKLTASGKKGRWNKDGEFVFYTAQHRSLATLEMTVHKATIQVAQRYRVMVISILDNEELIHRIPIKILPSNWKDTAAYSDLQNIASDWYVNNTSLVLQVPSVIVPQEYNYIINTKHPDFMDKNKISLVRDEEFFWDDRLLL